ncbi:hypothetical protein L226DRAFT_550491 [Lentinus tigrinus ALCF2SS1-7]|uniref:Yeast cell wall synthesis Kre9/Knh1-like N-terminal domain-containing protein n=1 Tax=Lentinus tigrinus ALCF2SS1-6 TaxID=1328759 RepID=A0A5C2SRT0_9APHY|nr:hypothetical protein L227DRAFT_570435 [Lentinus tigrinus ALCF2SS1-6]RPD80497.1 hypothetical protein L226DRAFT_550491 [Lentinus tigrinus ALCF2SS1-7]
MSSQSTLSKCLFLLIAAFAIFFQIVAGLPTLEQRDVYVPPVLYPHKGTVWYKGQRHNVTWDNSDPPKSISNGAMIILRKGETETPLILAKDFDLRAGRTEITVPWVLEGDDYSVVLFGDSGNWSEDFTIKE